MLPGKTKLELDRWYPLREIPIQRQLVDDKTRYIVVAAGRRSGKTERAKRKIVKECMKHGNNLYFIAAPTYAQVKKIYWQDIKKMSIVSMLERKPSESDLIVYFNNGTELHLIGLDKPNRIEGIPWDGGIIDETAYIKGDAWTNSIAPALDTLDPSKPNKKAWCWLIGKPDGLNHFYKLFQYASASKDPEWSAYTWKSSELLDATTIDAAKRRMSPKQFRQEYEASFETVSGRIYEDYESSNYTNETILPHEQICYFCDFNFTPMSHGIGVCREFACSIRDKSPITGVYILDEIVLTSAVGQDNALEFVERYKNHKNKSIRLYGDRSGKNGEKHGMQTEYSTMERVFENAGWKVDRRVHNSNPSIKDSQNAVRAKICNANDERSLFVNTLLAPWMHQGLATVQVKSGSSFLEDDKNEYQHITTALRYFIDYEWPIDDTIVDLNVIMFGENPYLGDDHYGTF